MDAKAFVKNAAKFCVTPIVSTVIAITIIPFVSRVYPTTEYGYISNFYSLGNLLLYMFLLGLDGAYTRFYYEPMGGVSNGRRCTFSIMIGVGVTIIAGAIAFLLFPEKLSVLIFGDQNTMGLLLLFIYVAALIVFTLLNLSVRFDEDAKGYNIQQAILLICTRLIYVVAAIYSTRYIYSVAVMTVSTVLMTFLVSFKRKDKLMQSPFIPMDVAKKLLIFALPVMPTTVFVQLNSSIANLILGAFGYRNEVGILALATSVANVFTIIPKIFTTYWGPFIYKYYKTEQQLIKNIHDAMMMISLLLTVGILMFQDLLYLVVGGTYQSSQPYFMLVMLAPVAVLIAETTNYGVTISKKPVINLGISIIVCLINVAVCYLLIPTYGEMGAVMGIVFAAIMNGTLRTLAGNHFYQVISKPIKTITTSLLIIGLCASNLFIWNSLLYRCIVGIFSVLMCILIYKKDLLRIIHALPRRKKTSQ